jgi:hypothetical protein
MFTSLKFECAFLALICVALGAAPNRASSALSTVS